MIVNNPVTVYSRLVYVCLFFIPISVASAAQEPIDHGVVLQYHHVDTSTPALTSITPKQFQIQMDYLMTENYLVWPLDKLVSHIATGEAIPDRVVAITFDDAYLSILETALPILKEHNWPFTVFVATHPVDRGYDDFLNWTQLRELQSAGALIASHTQSHTHLIRRESGEAPAAWRQRMREEILGAEERIQQETGQSSKLFAYPYGEFDNELKQVVGELGFVGFGQQSGAMGRYSDPLALPRFPISGNYADMDGFKIKAKSLPLPVVRQSSALNSLLPVDGLAPALTIDLAAGDYRRDQLACYATEQGRIEVDWVSDLRFTAVAGKPLPVGRSRYNCTLPTWRGGRYFWYSHGWIRKEPDGSWYRE
jgi:biofilm PGA synthesis lipoprotein PgaB